MVYKEGRHFVLYLLKFVFQITGRHLPPYMQELLDEFPIDDESKFTVKITKAVLIFVSEYKDFGGELAEITSPSFHYVLNSITLHEDFLEFLGYYALKCVSESEADPDNTAIFLTAVTNYLEGIKKIDGVCMDDYWEELDQAAARIVVRDIEIYKGKCISLRDPYFQIDIASEKEFIIDVMNYIFGLYDAPGEIKLKRKEGSQDVLSPNIQAALQITVNHHASRFHLLRDYEPMNIHFHNLSTNAYTDDDFLEYCVCCTRQAVFEYTRDNNLEAPKTACDHLVNVLQRAKEDGKFTSLERMDEAACRLITINNERMAHRRNRCFSILKRKSECIEDPSVSGEKSKKDAH